MGKCNLPNRQIVKYNDFCQQRKTKQIKENNEVAIDVPFYNTAKEQVIAELRSIAGGEPINWEYLVSKVKEKFIILDRELKDDNSMVLDHIRDILYQNFFSSAWIEGNDTGSASLGTRALALSQLSSDCLQQVRTEAGIDPILEPETEPKPIATFSIENYSEDDGFYENKWISTSKRHVSEYAQYKKSLNESLARIANDHGKDALNYVLNKVEEAAGSLRMNDIDEVLEGEDKTLIDFLNGITLDYLSKQDDLKLNEQKSEEGDLRILHNQAQKHFAHSIIYAAIERIKDANRTKESV